LSTTPAPDDFQRPVPIVTLMTLCALSQAALAMYLPSGPAIVASLATNDGMVQLVLTAYMAAYAAVLPVVGPLSDRFGRKPPLIAGTLIFLTGSLACAASPAIEWLLAARMIQAIGGCCCVVVSRASVRDLATGPAGARAMYWTSIAMSMTGFVSPFIGGWLQVWFGWQASFLFMAAIALAVMLFGALRLQETATRGAASGQVWRSYATLFRHRNFVLSAVGVGFGSGSFYSFLSASPAVFMGLFGLTVQEYSFIPMSWAIGFTSGGILATRLVGRLPPQSLLFTGLGIALAAGLVMTAITFTGSRNAVLYAACIVFFGLGNSFNVPQGMNLALISAPRELAGAASSGVIFSQFIIGGISTVLMAVLPHDTPFPMVVITSLAMLCSLLCYLRIGGARLAAMK
jgi:DHA1 family bicyclomycin/chloramphenicol resistance-like MFS transporter